MDVALNKLLPKAVRTWPSRNKVYGDTSNHKSSPMTVRVHEYLNRLNMRLYAVIDTARDRRIFSLIEESGCEYETIYGKGLASTMDGRGPYLIPLHQGTSFLERLITAGWGNSWGIYLAGPTELQVIRRHLRRLFSVKLGDGRQALFRFYDPRVLRDYLPSCTDDELSQFFGPIGAIYLESEKGRELLRLSYDRAAENENPQSARLIQFALKL